MRYLLDDIQAKALDQYTIGTFGLHSLILMERAAYEVAACIKRLPGEKRRVFVMSGTGNNGADGLAAARILSQEGCVLEVAVVGSPEKATSEWQYQRMLLQKLGVKVWEFDEEKEIPAGFDVYVDALFGIGLKREISGQYRRAVESFTEAAMEAVVVAVDICSGIDAATGAVRGVAVRASCTVTFGYGKLGQYLYPGADYSGRIVTAKIGLAGCTWGKESPVCVAEAKDVRWMLGRRDPGGNKGTFGRVLVVAGAAGMAGAAYLAAKSAYRAGAGLVQVYTAPENRTVLQEKLPEAVLITGEGEERKKRLLEALPAARAIVVGPGLSQSAEAERVLETVLARRGRIPTVIDADGLNLLARKGCRKLDGQVILTPHLLELARLLGISVSEIKSRGLREISKSLYQATGAVSVCKDARTIVRISGEEVYLNVTGNDGMAVGGSGDVLAGVLGGLLAQGIAVEEAAVAGVYLHGLAGDIAAESVGRHGMMASELSDAVAESIRRTILGDGVKNDGGI